MVETLDGQDVMSAQDVRARIAGHQPGSKVRLDVDRGTQRIHVEVPVIEAPRGTQQ